MSCLWENECNSSGYSLDFFVGRFGSYLEFALSLQPQTRNKPPLERKLTRARVAEVGRKTFANDVSKATYLCLTHGGVTRFTPAALLAIIDILDKNKRENNVEQIK